MTIYTAIKGEFIASSTSLEILGGCIGANGATLRTLFSQRKTDVMTYKGHIVGRCPLKRIKGRGNGLKRA
jgi:hypothetical protein